MAEYIKQGGTWKTVSGDTTPSTVAYVKVAGTWRSINAQYIKVDGTWRAVSTFSAQYVVPNVVGQTLAAAQSAITASGNSVGSTSTTSSGATSGNNGQVQSQSVAAGSYGSVQTVNLVTYAYSAPIINAIISSVIATPSQQNSISSYSTSGYIGSSMTISGSFPATITNIIVGSTYVSFSQTSSTITWTMPSISAGSYSVQVYDGQIPLLSAFTVTNNGNAPIVATPVNYQIQIATPVNYQIATPVNYQIQIAFNPIQIQNTIAYVTVLVGATTIIQNLTQNSIQNIFYHSYYISPYYGVRVSCIHGDTLMKVYEGDVITTKKARDIKPGDELVGVVFKELDPAVKVNTYDWQATALTYDTIQRTTVVKVEPSVHERFMYFNDDEASVFSMSEPMLVGRNGQYEFFASGMILEGDTLFKLKPDNSGYDEVIIEKITFTRGEDDGFNFHCEPDHVIVAGDYIVHNK
jgi:hypothetical protein